MITISKMYYEENLSQEEISRKMKISIPQVSRIVTAAKKEGYVKTTVTDPFSESDSLTERITKTFDLKDARIVESGGEDLRLSENRAAQATADYLLNTVQTNDVISLAFSSITYRIPQYLPKMHIENLSFVQPNGTLFEHVKGYQFDTLRETGMKLDALYYYFPAPAFVKDLYMKENLHNDPTIKWVLDMANRSNVSLFSVDCPGPDSLYVTNGYFTQDEMEEIRKKGSVGEVFGHFINEKGEINDPDLEDRVLGMEIAELCRKDYAVCVATGKRCVPALKAALAGKYCNVLITDTGTARELLWEEN